MIKKVLTEQYGTKNIIKYLTGDDKSEYIGAEIYVLLSESNFHTKRTRYNFRGVVNKEGKELVKFDNNIVEVIGVTSDTFIIKRSVIDADLGSMSSYTNIHELYKIVDKKAQLLCISDDYIQFLKNNQLAVSLSGHWNHIISERTGNIVVCSFNNKPVTHIYDMNKLEDKTLIEGRYEKLNENTLIISLDRRAYLYDVDNDKKMSDTFTSINISDSRIYCSVIFEIIKPKTPYTLSSVIAFLRCFIDEKGNYISLVYDTLNDTFIDPRDPSFSIEKESERLEKQLIEFAKIHNENDVKIKELKLFNAKQ